MYRKEFGSNFFDEIEPSRFYLNDSESVMYFDAGRSAIRYLLHALEGKIDTVLLPQYTCESVIEPFVENGYNIFYYPINKKFEISLEIFKNIAESTKPQLVVVQSYFGANTLYGLRKYLGELQKKEVIVVEDITHSLLIKQEHNSADYLVASLRKWCSIPDGGLLASRTLKTKKLSLQSKLGENEMYLQLRLGAQAQKRRFFNLKGDELTEKQLYIDLFERSEDILNRQKNCYSMSDYSRVRILGIDWEEIKQRRRANYFQLCKEFSYVPELEIVDIMMECNTVPLYCPVYVKGGWRDDLQRDMRLKNIMISIIWPESNSVKAHVTPEVKWIYEHILAIPCDQRYSVEDMKRVAAEIRMGIRRYC